MDWQDAFERLAEENAKQVSLERRLRFWVTLTFPVVALIIYFVYIRLNGPVI